MSGVTLWHGKWFTWLTGQIGGPLSRILLGATRRSGLAPASGQLKGAFFLFLSPSMYAVTQIKREVLFK